ncbi:Putative cryptic C4-dicarboxylate transporter DcuD [Aquisphaera giovannonii]|uniref:Cryptic C4-dicarboxylate transporter DcuD n=1 Tax=Aquisphaera giovannonii TaxID=406548 RepID=A0A5B9W0Y9_9BACT|nr:C4-dicarboxylate transporter DcuC [Aquisphaera giovannonii]QEH33590.1 Putative cryptic C4-dicarboxylate transporter DcuD [Aquisphaera giovannonii]
MNPTIAIAILVLLAATALIVRGVEVRLVLLAASVPLFALTGGMVPMLDKVVAEMANAATVVPICSALGFAHVLKLTGCDQQLVRLLLKPLRRVRWLLVPGGIAAGYVINSTIVSQTGTAAVLGPILVPLLLASGLGPEVAGAVLLLGSSMGGELFNPGAVEMRKLAELTGLSGHEAVLRSARLNLLACGSALLAFWLSAPRRDAAQDEAEGRTIADVPEERVNLLKAVVPVVPLLILFADPLLAGYSPIHDFRDPARILAAMLIGIVLAGLTSPRAIRRFGTAFFDGAGYAYTHVISLIVAASTFAEGIRLSGLIGLIIRGLVGSPGLTIAVAAVAPWALAVASGTGIAPAVSVMEFFVPVSSSMGIDPVRLGTLASLGAHFGRTMSPAAAVVAMCATLSGASASRMIRLVAGPLAAGGLIMIAAALLKVA